MIFQRNQKWKEETSLKEFKKKKNLKWKLFVKFKLNLKWKFKVKTIENLQSKWGNCVDFQINSDRILFE